MNYKEFIPIHSMVDRNGNVLNNRNLYGTNLLLDTYAKESSNNVVITKIKPDYLPWQDNNFVTQVIKKSKEANPGFDHTAFSPNVQVNVLPSLYSDEEAWRLIESLHWTDNDDSDRCIMELTSSAVVRKKNIKQAISQFIPKLSQILFNKDPFKDFGQVIFNNICYHIIAKGKNFYNLVLEDYTLAIYVCDKYRVLFAYLS